MPGPEKSEREAAIDTLIAGVSALDRAGFRAFLDGSVSSLYVNETAGLWLKRYKGLSSEYWKLIKIASPGLKLTVCKRCQNPGTQLFPVEGKHEQVCGTCRHNHYLQCLNCHAYRNRSSIIKGTNRPIWHPVIDEQRGVHRICNVCYAQHDDYRHCGNCGNDFREADRGRNAHYCFSCSPPDKSACISRGALDFVFPARTTAHEAISAEQLAEIVVSGGTIGSTARQSIYREIYNATEKIDPYGYRLRGIAVAELIETPSSFSVWQTKEGNFSKRLAKLVYQKYNLKLDEELMARIANIAQQYASKEKHHHIAFTRDINRSPQEFVNVGSCWWAGYSISRCHFKELGGIAIRTFENGNEKRPISRAFIIPLSKTLRPTLNIPASAYFVFNAYGLELFEFARIIAQMTGLSYGRVTTEGPAREHLYINNNSGALVAEQSLIVPNQHIRIAVRKTCTCKL